MMPKGSSVQDLRRGRWMLGGVVGTRWGASTMAWPKAEVCDRGEPKGAAHLSRLRFVDKGTVWLLIS